MVEISSQLFIPVGAVLAACITGAVAFVSLIISKEQKTSEFRQTWIDSLRSELAEFSAQARRVAAEQTPLYHVNLHIDEMQLPLALQKEDHPDPLLTNRQRLAQTYYCIRLRLNISETDHQTIVTHLDKVYEILNTRSESVRFDETVTELDMLSEVAQSVLKREWKLVKGGEPAFAATKVVTKWTAMALALVLISVLGCWLWIALSAT